MRGAALVALALMLIGAGTADAGGRPLSLRPVFPALDVALPVATDASDAEPVVDFPFLDGEATDRSLSIDDTSHGFLVNGQAVTESDALAILPVQRERNLRHGSEELIGALEFAAAQYHATTDRKLWIGNVGREHGGDIPWSVSHNSGRDADIAFAYLDHERKPVDPPDLVVLDGHGVSRKHGLFFDAHGTWLIVKGLLSYPGAQVQYLFIEAGLRDQVLVAAKKAGEPVGIIQRAAAVMRQPAGSSPHSDHLHVRIYCSRRDVIAGCLNTGVVHPWAQLHERAKETAVAAIAGVMRGGGVDQRQRAIQRLVLLDATGALGGIRERLDDEAPEVRAAAARALGRLGTPGDVEALAARLAVETELDPRVALVQSAGRLGGELAGQLLAAAVGAPRRDPRRVLDAMGAATELHSPVVLSLLPEAASWSRRALSGAFQGGLDGPLERWLLAEGEAERAETAVQLTAIAASAEVDRLEPVPALVELLTDRDPTVRSLAAHSLRMITNVTYWTDWAAGDDKAREAGLTRWRAAWRRSRLASRAAWIVMGFRAAGYAVPAIQQKHLWELVRATAGADHLSYNAQRILARLTGHDPESLSWSKNEACQHWLRWLKKRRRAYELEKPPGKVVAACYAPAL